MAYFFKLPPITDLTIGQQSALNDPNPISISGGPGTGKSVASLWRHIRNYGIGNKSSLLLTYTKTLERYLSSSASSENSQAGNAVNRTYWWLTHHAKNYDEIIIDEAQDVEEEKYLDIKKYSSNISYGADDEQSIYPNKATSESKLKELFPKNNNYVLGENFRNSYEILLFIKALFRDRNISHDLLQNLIANNRRGTKPTLLVTSHIIEKQNTAIVDIIKQFQSETHNIAVLVPFVSEVNFYHEMIQQNGITCSKFANTHGELGIIENVHITTLKSSKGTEFDTVIIPNFEKMRLYIATKDVVEENDYYVTLSRARRNLYLISATVPDFLMTSEQQKETYNTEFL